jgi:uroporphyrin-III C-methyltransferase
MGIHGAAQLQRQLLLGLPENTPVAIVQHASLSQQRHALCTLAQLERTLLREHLGSPSVIVVGQVLKGLLALSTNAV